MNPPSSSQEDCLSKIRSVVLDLKPIISLDTSLLTEVSSANLHTEDFARELVHMITYLQATLDAWKVSYVKFYNPLMTATGHTFHGQDLGWEFMPANIKDHNKLWFLNSDPSDRAIDGRMINMVTKTFTQVSTKGKEISSILYYFTNSMASTFGPNIVWLRSHTYLFPSPLFDSFPPPEATFTIQLTAGCVYCSESNDGSHHATHMCWISL
jgi:hypothetical protein